MKLNWVYLSFSALILSACQVLGTKQPTSNLPHSSTSSPPTMSNSQLTPQPTVIIPRPPTPTSSIIPTVISYSPTTIPTLTPVSPNETILLSLISAANISFDSWSRDSQWIAYWVSSIDDVKNPINYYIIPGSLGFTNVNTGISCIVDRLRRQGEGGNVEWMDDNEMIVIIGEIAYQGKPCQEAEYQNITNYKPTIAREVEDPLISPDRLYRALDQELEYKNGICKYATSIIRRVDGKELVVAEWRMQERIGGCGSSSKWISKTQYLIEETLDQGPLILDVNWGVINVLKDLFQLTEIPSLLDPNEYDLYAQALSGFETDTYHLLVSGIGTESNFPDVRLYHAESGLVETLPFKYAWEPGFSNDGKWLLMDGRPGVEGYQRRLLSVRLVEGKGLDWKVIIPIVDEFSWSNNGKEIISSEKNMISWREFPNARIIGMWDILNYDAVNFYFSPDLKKVVVIGIIFGKAVTESTSGLFIVHK